MDAITRFEIRCACQASMSPLGAPVWPQTTARKLNLESTPKPRGLCLANKFDSVKRLLIPTAIVMFLFLPGAAQMNTLPEIVM